MLYNSFTEYKNILKTFTIEEQLKPIEATIISLATRNIKEILKIIDIKE